MMKRIIKYKNAKYSIHSHSGGSNLLYFECEHIKRQKGSIKIPQKTKCGECECNQLEKESE